MNQIINHPDHIATLGRHYFVILDNDETHVASFKDNPYITSVQATTHNNDFEFYSLVLHKLELQKQQEEKKWSLKRSIDNESDTPSQVKHVLNTHNSSVSPFFVVDQRDISVAVEHLDHTADVAELAPNFDLVSRVKNPLDSLPRLDRFRTARFVSNQNAFECQQEQGLTASCQRLFSSSLGVSKDKEPSALGDVPTTLSTQ